MKLKELLEGIEIIKLINVDKEKEITNLTINHNTATSESMFFAIKGEHFNGNEFASEVLKKGGVVVTDNKEFAGNVLVSGGKNVILTQNARCAMSNFSANFYNNPQEKLKIISVVGTNGKTSTACIIRDIFEYCGIRTGIIGTLETKFEEKIYQSDMTTPDPIKLFEILKDMQSCGCKVVVMEWSAHAIALKKLENLTSEVAIFTNLSQDHLDFFENMEKYKEVKKSIFTKEHVKMAVINADDKTGGEIMSEARVPILSCGIENVCDVFCIFSSEMQKYTHKIISGENKCGGISNGKFIVNYLDEICEIKTNLKGRFNTYNLLSAITTARYFGLSFEKIKEAVLKIQCVKGRYQSVENNKGIEIVVDYAHTPDGMENILREMKSELKLKNSSNLSASKLFCVFGCGGNRDKTKRQIMGSISEKYADITIITSDNPRLEKRADIANDILQGFENPNKAVVILDREEAIKFAISQAQNGDSIAVLGKGHEEYIEENGKRSYFSDIETVKKYI